MGGWVALEVWVGILLSLWNLTLTTDTAFWFVFSGLVLFVNFEEACTKSDFFRTKALAAFAPAVLLEGFLDEFAFHLAAEIPLQALLLLFVMLATVASSMGDHYRSAAAFSNTIVALIIVGVIVASLVQLITGWSQVDKANLVRQAVLPGWLTIALLPTIYLIAVYAAYELAFMRMSLPRSGPPASWSAKLALLTSLHLKAREIASFTGPWPRRLVDAGSFAEARSVVAEFRAAKAEERRKAAEATARLARYAGVDGVDADGRRLDRREFDETTKALRWLAVCMMGWYRHDDRYVPDLLERTGDDFTSFGLPQPSGITMRVDKHGQAWYAWRRTATGWCFAIGAAGPPPDQWEYDGTEAPVGFPGKDPAWGSHAFSDEANHNW